MFMLFLVFQMYSKVIWKYICIHNMLAIGSEYDGWTKTKAKLSEFGWPKPAEIRISRNKIVDQWHQIIDWEDYYQLKNHTFVQTLKDCQNMTHIHIQLTSNLSIKLQKRLFPAKMTIFQIMMRQVWTTVRMWICIGMQAIKNWKRKHLR